LLNIENHHNSQVLNAINTNLIQILHIVEPIRTTIVATKMRIEKKYLDFIAHFSECNFLILIPNNIRIKTISGIVTNSNTALKKLLGIIFPCDMKINNKK